MSRNLRNSTPARRSGAASRRGQRGVTMIEVLVTLIVLSIGLLGLAALQGVSLQTNHSAYLRTQATNIAYEMLDTWRANRREVLNGASLPGDFSEWQARVSAVLPGGGLTVERAGELFTVAIVWGDGRWEADAADQTVTFVVTTQI